MEMKKRIVHLTNIPTPYRIYFFNVLDKYLKNKNIELIVIYCSKSEPNRNWKIDPNKINFKYKFLKCFTLNFDSFYVHINPFIFTTIFKLRPDILFNAGSWNMISGIISLLPFHKKNCKKIFWSEGHKNSVRNPKGFFAFLRKKVIRLYDFFAVPNINSSNFIMDDCLINKEKIIFLPNTIQENIFLKEENTIQENTIQENIFLKNKIKKLTIVASLEKRKGYLELINALKILPKSIRNIFHIEIIGEGPLYSYIKTNLNKLNISYEMLGNLQPEEVSYFLRKSNGFLLPSLNDPNPLSAIEGLASGIPLLLSNYCGNINECVVVNKNGWIFNPYDKVELSNTIKAWSLSSFKQLNEMGSFSKLRYKELFSIDKVCHEFANNLFSIINT